MTGSPSSEGQFDREVVAGGSTVALGSTSEAFVGEFNRVTRYLPASWEVSETRGGAR